MLSSHNEYTVAGTVQITLVASGGGAAATNAHADCQFQASSGYAGGQLGPAQPLPGGEPVGSKVDCCDACDRDPKCSKVTTQRSVARRSVSRRSVSQASVAQRSAARCTARLHVPQRAPDPYSPSTPTVTWPSLSPPLTLTR